MIRSLFILSAAVAALSVIPATPATANDAPWTGVYVGLHVGANFGSGDVATGCDDPTGSLDGSPNCSLTTSSGLIPTDYDTSSRGVIGGGALGYHYQTGTLVVGIEADISKSSADGDDSSDVTAFLAPALADIQVQTAVTHELSWLGTVRGKIGVTNGNMLIYGTGGFAFGDVETSYRMFVPISGFTFESSNSGVETGWTIGGGAEWALGTYSIKAEYLYYDLGDQSVVASGSFAGVTLAGTINSDFETSGHIARAGVNFKLN